MITSIKATSAASGPRAAALASLFVATAVGSSGLAAGGTAGALLAERLVGSSAAGVPLGVLVAGSAISALVMSRTTPGWGRGRSLMVGYLVGAVGAVGVVGAAEAESFALLLMGSFVLGGASAAVFLTRYAAAEAGGEAARGRALGTVFFATALGAVASPNLLGASGDLAVALGLPRLSGLYVIATVAFSVAAAVLALASHPRVPVVGRGAALLGPASTEAVQRGELARIGRLSSARTALVLLAGANFVMVAVMAIAPLAMTTHGHHLRVVGLAVSLHVAGMFAPSPVSGWLADRAGPRVVAAIGFAALVGSGIVGALIDGDSAAETIGVLAVLGVGWNFGVVGGSTRLAASVTPALRPRAEGIGEVAMGLAAAAAAPAAGVVAAAAGFAALSLAVAGAAAMVATLIARWPAPLASPDADPGHRGPRAQGRPSRSVGCDPQARSVG
jgi:MFS family permease